MIDAQQRVREETFDELKRLAIALRLTPVKLARLCRRLQLDVVVLREHVEREVLRR